TLLSGKIFAPGVESREINVGYSQIWKIVSTHHGLREAELSEYYLKYGDLGSAIEDWLQNGGGERKQEKTGTLFLETDLSLQEFYSALKDLARTSGKGSSDRRYRILERVFSRLSDPLEAKYAVRILGGEMRIGLVEGLVEESISKAFSKTLDQVRSANLVTGDVGEVAVLAKFDRLNKARLSLFKPTNFMLAQTAENAEALFKKIGEIPSFAEYKYDGIRAQLHYSEGVAKIFSRNLEDVTRYFPEITKAAQTHLTKPIVIDGEIVPFQNGLPLSFQALQRRLRKLIPSPDDVPVKYFAFDLLYYERPLIEEPLSERIRLLRSLDFQDPLGFSMQKPVTTVEEIQGMFDESKNLGYEGLVVKIPESQYSPGRRGKSWIKLKKELDTLDVVIVAAEYGHGKRAGVISDYTFAVRDTDGLKVVGQAYSGLTDVEIKEMTQLLKDITTQDFGYRRSVKPQVVLEVAFDAIQKSERHDGGYALRFPRIKRIRSDKSVSDIDTLEKVKEIYENQKVKI
ncbi:MAG: ATP-dependent DNA ligase, partial [Nitrososphaerales archaeon]